MMGLGILFAESATSYKSTTDFNSATELFSSGVFTILDWKCCGL